MNLLNIVSTGHRKGPNFKGYPIIQQNIKGTQHAQLKEGNGVHLDSTIVVSIMFDELTPQK